MTEQEIAAYKEQVFPGNGQSIIQPPTPPPVDTPPITDTPPVTDKIVDTPPPVDNPPVVTNELKEKLGFEDWDAAQAAIADLKQKAETPAEKEFANEQSKLAYSYLKEGKTKELKQFLETQEKLESFTSAEVTEDTAPDIIKLGMQLKHKDLSPKEIDYKFNKEFGIPKEPVQKNDELDEEFEARKEEWQEKVNDIKMNLMIEAKLAKPELVKTKAELVLPDISKPDADYEQYKASRADQPQRDAETKEAYSKISTKDVAMVFKFNDEALKLAFDVTYEPDKESFDKSVSLASDLNSFLSNYYGKDGSPDRTRFLKDLYAGQNIQKIVTEAMVEAVNAERARFLRTQKNISTDGQRNYVVPPQTDVDKLREQVFGKTG